MRARIEELDDAYFLPIPEQLLERAGLGTDVTIVAAGHARIIAPYGPARSGWSLAFAAMAEAGDDGLLDPPSPTEFDEKDWAW